MRNSGLEETQAGIKIAGRNINNLRYADDTTIIEESEEELNEVNIRWIMEKQESSRKTSISALLTMPKPLTVWITINCGEF